MSDLDETKIIDRDEELATFRRMVTFEAPHRVLVVSHRAGMGKTDLLRKLRLHCERDLGLPVGLVQLGHFTQRQDEFDIVKCLYKALKETGASLPTFEDLEGALGYTLNFLDRLGSVKAFVDLSNAQLSDQARAAALMFNIEKIENFTLPEWNDVIDARARELCVRAFLLDLDRYTQTNTVVLLIDGLDEVGHELRRWVLNEFVRRGALNNWQQRKLVVALAGEDSADMVRGRLPADQHAHLHVVTAFGVWQVEEVRLFLEVNGIRSLADGELQAMQLLLSAGHPLTWVLGIASGIGSNGR